MLLIVSDPTVAMASRSGSKLLNRPCRGEGLNRRSCEELMALMAPPAAAGPCRCISQGPRAVRVTVTPGNAWLCGDDVSALTSAPGAGPAVACGRALPCQGASA